ncbi:MAG: VCBS repeat-containing protein, partial [Verrucomicrobia bacterium]|nr:VCBS repeat-containing protein [Verrucomicrobiota bacterium]
PLLAELGTSDALTAAQAATRDNDPELAKDAVRVLAQWPNAAPAPYLLELARTSTDSTLHTLALRGCIEVAGQEPDLTKRFAMLQQAGASAKSADEKKQVLGQLGQVATPEALEVVLKDLADPGLVNEAALAAVSIAEKLAPSNPQLADEAAAKVLVQVKQGEVAKRAWAMRIKPSSAASFIRDWVVCDPYRQAGATGAEAVFNIPFGPEKAGEKVQWKTVPGADHVNFMALFGAQSSCVAYLRAQIIAAADCSGALLMGSDDGIKAWLNGEVVHSNNVDRGQVVDQDTAPIKLKKGTNDLMLKITQGGGGWSACARFVGTDGKPIPGLLVQRPGGAAGPVKASAAKPAAKPAPAAVAKPATPPQRDAFQKVRLSDQFYTEGACYGDFNRDGKMDIVAGPFWFEGPDFQKRHEYRPAKVYDPKGYSDNFLTYTGDFNGDGWTDVLCVPFPGAEGFWYENPAGKDQPWKQHLAYSKIGNESPVWGDVDGDGKPELIFNNDGYLGYAGPNPAKPDEPWVFHAVSPKEQRFQKFTHGVGFGDLNGDKRVDLIEATGWWEQPANAQTDQPWTFHPFHFADDGAQMLVYDVDGDGLADVITAWHCHHYGLVWWQQIKGADGQPDWKKHVILSPTPDVATADFRVSQMHALELVDMNGDGLKDILTGKRFWAHGPTGDKEPDAPAVVFWLELRRDGQGGATFIPHLIDDDSGVGTQVSAVDLNGDGRPDVIVGNKKGIFVHLSKAAGK